MIFTFEYSLGNNCKYYRYFSYYTRGCNFIKKNCTYICKLLSILFLFLGVSSSHSRIFHSYWDVTITDEGLQILTNTRLSWPLRSEGSFKCHTYCDTRDIRLYGHIQGPVTFTLLYWIDWIVFCAVLAIFQPFNGDAPTHLFGSGAVTTCFNDLIRSVPTQDRIAISQMIVHRKFLRTIALPCIKRMNGCMQNKNKSSTSDAYLNTNWIISKGHYISN